MRNVNALILSASDATSQTSIAIVSDQLVSASFQSVFGDTSAAGTIKIQASNDINNAMYNNNFIPTNWSDISSATSTVVAGVAPIIFLPNLSYQYLRVVFTSSAAGSTTIKVSMSAFGV